MAFSTIFYRGWRPVLGGFLIHLVLGTLYCWGIFTTAVTSRLRKFDNSITYNGTLMVYATALAVQGMLMIPGGLLERRIGARYTCLIGGYTLVLGVYLSSMAESLPFLVFTNGAMFGVGLGLCYAAPIASATRCLPKQKGLVTGIIVAGFGGGAFVFSSVASLVLHRPDDPVEQLAGGYFSPNSLIAKRVPALFEVLAYCYFVLISLGCFFLNPEDALTFSHLQEKDFFLPSAPVISADGVLSFHVKEDPPGQPYFQSTIGDYPGAGLEHGDREAGGAAVPLLAGTVSGRREAVRRVAVSGGGIHSSSDDALKSDIADSKYVTLSSGNASSPATPSVNSGGLEIGPLTMLAHPLAWHLMITFVFTSIGGMYLAGTYRVYAQESFKEATQAYLTEVGSTAAIFSAVGRVLWGALADRLGYLETLFILSFLFTLVIASYSRTPLWGCGPFALWTYAIFFCEGGNFALYMPLTVQFFGSKNAASNYGVVFTFYQICNVLNISALASLSVTFHQASSFNALVTLLGCVNLFLLRIHAASVRKISSGALLAAGMTS